jgi:hypothetical protein
MSESEAKKVEAVVASPVVSEDSNSQEQKMMRDAKLTQIQTETDTKYDAVLERFYVQPTPISRPLVGVAVALGLLGLSVIFSGLKKRR